MNAEVCLEIEALGKLLCAWREWAVVERLAVGIRGRDSALGSVSISGV